MTPTTEDLPDTPPAAPPPAPSHPRPSMAFLIIVSVVTLVLDFASKHWVTTRLDGAGPGGGRTVKIIDGVLAFISAKNRGGAWGLLQDESESIRKPFFMLISAAAILFIVTLYRRVTPEQTALKWGLPLVLGGAVGNLVDRVRYGYVVDFIDVTLTKSFRWPTFNVADIAIVAGVALMAIDMFTPRKPAVDSKGEAKDSPSGDEGKTLRTEDETPAAPPADKA
ncbi:MAG: signal peptidase II [Polyangiaceae bacterium]|nr:signal peptidase II [Polyangiaceae bacterium]NUQ79532.1 signal peptidase II [Polyangiaceae bacterium]